MGLACLALSDEVTDVLSLITFYRNGAWPFFKASLTILIVSSLLGGFFGFAAGEGRKGSHSVGPCWGTVLGLFGLSPIVEAVADLRGGEETRYSGLVKIFEAQGESAPQFMLQLCYLTVTTWRAAWDSSRVVVLSAAVSFVTLALGFATYPNSPAGSNGVVRIPLRDGHRGTKVVLVSFLFYFASDLALRAAAVCVLVKHGAHPNVQDRNGNTPLHFAAELNNRLAALALDEAA